MYQRDDTPDLQPVRIDIPPEIRLYVIQLLQQTLACTLDLRSHVKQASWNVKGHDCGPLQAIFATMATALEAYSDLVAARLVALGGVAHGTVRTAALGSTLPEYPRCPPGGLRPCAGAGGAFCTLCHGAAGRYCARCRGRGCGQCGTLHGPLTRGRPTARELGRASPPLTDCPWHCGHSWNLGPCVHAP